MFFPYDRATQNPNESIDTFFPGFEIKTNERITEETLKDKFLSIDPVSAMTPGPCHRPINLRYLRIAFSRMRPAVRSVFRSDAILDQPTDAVDEQQVDLLDSRGHGIGDP